MRNVLLSLAFIGTEYGGWQVQKNKKTVQQTVQAALESAFGTECAVTGCSRTDSGVHANMFCCCASLPGDANAIPEKGIPMAVNLFLPNDISVKFAKDVPESFHPRYDAVGKEYVYKIWNADYKDPFMVGRSLIYTRRLNEELMDAAAKKFVGSHDFAAFMAAGSKITDTVREIYSSRVTREGDTVFFTVSGNGFLYNMVRIMTGTLIDVSNGRISCDDIPNIIKSGNRQNAGATVSPEGLYLNRVFYNIPGMEFCNVDTLS